MDEVVEDKYVINARCAKARKFLIMKWMFLAFLLNASYRSVLLSTIVSPLYEKPVDTIVDMLKTETPIYALNTSGISWMLRSDPRVNVREVGNKVLPFGPHPTKPSSAPTWVIER